MPTTWNEAVYNVIEACYIFEPTTLGQPWP